MLNRIPTLIGLSEGFDILKEVFQDVDELVIAGEKAKIWEKSIQIREDDFGQTDSFFDYQFTSPWMALKEENYETYKTLDKIEKQQFLRHLLRENLKTVSKGFHYNIPNIESVKSAVQTASMNFKNIRMNCHRRIYDELPLAPISVSVSKSLNFGAPSRNENTIPPDFYRESLINQLAPTNLFGLTIPPRLSATHEFIRDHRYVTKVKTIGE